MENESGAENNWATNLNDNKWTSADYTIAQLHNCTMVWMEWTTKAIKTHNCSNGMNNCSEGCLQLFSTGMNDWSIRWIGTSFPFPTILLACEEPKNWHVFHCMVPYWKVENELFGFGTSQTYQNIWYNPYTFWEVVLVVPNPKVF
jgi:hypothetical protein